MYMTSITPYTLHLPKIQTVKMASFSEFMGVRAAQKGTKIAPEHVCSLQHIQIYKTKPELYNGGTSLENAREDWIQNCNL